MVVGPAPRRSFRFCRLQTSGKGYTLRNSAPIQANVRRRMDHEGNDLSEMDMAARQYFVTFMAKATQFEELGSQGSQLLAGFHQELELFRRPPLNKMSKVLVSIIENNQNERLRGYVQAGCRHFSSDAHVTIKLHNFIQGLNKNIEQARELLEDLEHIVDNVTAIMQKSTNLLLECINIPTQDNSSEGSLGSENEEGSLLHGSAHRLEISDYMAMMSVIYGMLRQDYIMQEKVVSALQLDTPSEILESYHLMWTLRPFVDERVFNEALNWT